MRAAFLILMLSAAVALAQEKRDENEVVFASETDPDMVVAIRKARESLDGFLALAASPPANTDGFKVKVMVRDGREVEHFWVTPFRVVGSGFQGVLANAPRVVRNVRAGQILAFSRGEISDRGQADYYRRSHGFDC